MNDFIAVEEITPLKLREPLSPGHKNVGNYRPAHGLKEAIDVAMLLGVPMLLTGEPGTGKSCSAAWLAGQLGTRAVLRHDVKSSTSGRDLLYSFDEIARFRDGNSNVVCPLIDYVQFSALGESIIRAAGGLAPLLGRDGQPLAGDHLAAHRTQIERAFGQAAADAGALTAALLLPREPGFAQADGEHCVVLIDELDKAPRDTPNDLLAEIDDMAFAIPELGVRIEAGRSKRPIVLITSNSEKSLPEPFLRRCAYFNIPEADDRELQEILSGAIPQLGGGALVDSAIAFYRDLRNNPKVHKKPGTSELIGWLDVLQRQPEIAHSMTVQMACRAYLERQEPDPDKPKRWPLVGVLMKSDDDIAIAMAILLA